MTTTYTKQDDLCLQGTCTFVLKAGVQNDTEKVGELWTARLQVWVDDVKVADDPALAIRNRSAAPVQGDAGCQPLSVPQPGDTISCQAWLEVGGDRIVDEERSVEVPKVPVIDNPLGPWTVDLVGATGGTPIWRVSFDIHENTGAGDPFNGALNGCYVKDQGEQLAIPCGEFAFKVSQDASLNGARLIRFPGTHSSQVDSLDDFEELQTFCNATPDPATCMAGIQTVDSNSGVFAGNLCGGPDGNDEPGDIWIDIAAPANAKVRVEALYETIENFDGDPPDTEADPCVQAAGDQTDFPGNYTGISFSETITLLD